MMPLAGVPYVPRHAVAASGDWTAAVVILVVIAVAFGVLAVVSYRTSRPQPTRKHEPADSNRKAA
jgi:hypothetical protein